MSNTGSAPASEMCTLVDAHPQSGAPHLRRTIAWSSAGLHIGNLDL